MKKKIILIFTFLLVITGCTQRKSDYIETSKDLGLKSEETESIYQDKIFMCTGDSKTYDKIVYRFRDDGTLEELLYINSDEPFVTPGRYHLHPHLKTKIDKEELDVMVFEVMPQQGDKDKVYIPFVIYKDELFLLDENMEPLTEYGCKSV